MNEKRYCLRIVCPDQKGLIATAAQAIADEGGNIIDLSQHTATDIDTFLLRAIFEAGKNFDKARFCADFEELYANRFSMRWKLIDLTRRQRVAIFVSKTDHCLYELLLKHRDGELDCDFPCVISNHTTLQPVVESFGISFHHVPSGLSKPDQEAQFAQILGDYKIDTVVLARYMQILRKEFTDLWQNEVINIHHGFLPAFKGAKPYHQAWTKGVKLIGATAHYANEELDQGPIIAQDVVQIEDRCAATDLVRTGKDVERRVLLRALKLHLAHSVFVRNGRTFVME